MSGFCALTLLSSLVFAVDAPNNSQELQPDEQYVQNIANKWIHVSNQNLNSPAVLKGQVSTTQDTYLLGVGDTITVMIPELLQPQDAQLFKGYGISSDGSKLVTQEPEGAFDVVIRTHGEATIPPFGVLKVGGLTVSQLTQMLQELVSYYLVDPPVFVSLKTPRPYTVYITGEVSQPGAYQTLNDPEESDRSLSSGNASVGVSQLFEPRLSMMIDKAGGILTHSDIEHVQVTNSRTGKDLTINLQSLLEGDTHQDIVLEPDDVVFIPKMKSENSADTLASTIGANSYTVQVLGYVTKPAGVSNTNGVLLGARSMTALNALSRVNTDPEADLTRLVILRKKPDGLEFDKIVFNGLASDMPLQPYDVLIVPHQRRTYQTRLLIQMAQQALLSPIISPVVSGSSN